MISMLGIEDIITGDNFVTFNNFIFNTSIKSSDTADYYNYHCTLNIEDFEKFNGIPIVYTQTDYAEELFDQLKSSNKNYILITHNSDWNVDRELFNKKNDSLIKWYSQNVNHVDELLESIPIGLENSIWFPGIQKKQQIIAKRSDAKNIKNLLYINHNVNTNRRERLEPYELFDSSSWCTLEYAPNGSYYENYLDNIYNHKFTLCPNGNGIDTHRVWESLYLNTIPIVKNQINYSFYTDLPMCFVNNWSDLTEEYLNQEYERITTETHNIEKLKMSYWKIKIKSATSTITS